MLCTDTLGWIVCGNLALSRGGGREDKIKNISEKPEGRVFLKIKAVDVCFG